MSMVCASIRGLSLIRECCPHIWLAELAILAPLTSMEQEDLRSK